jgi:hypothetical protein
MAANKRESDNRGRHFTGVKNDISASNLNVLKIITETVTTKVPCS